MSMEWGYVSELRPPTFLLFISQPIYESGEPQWNDIDGGKPKNSEQTLSQCKVILTDQGTNVGLRGECQRLTARATAPPQWQFK
jgi:hypothetical protein